MGPNFRTDFVGVVHKKIAEFCGAEGQGLDKGDRISVFDLITLSSRENRRRKRAKDNYSWL